MVVETKIITFFGEVLNREEIFKTIINGKVERDIRGFFYMSLELVKC